METFRLRELLSTESPELEQCVQEAKTSNIDHYVNVFNPLNTKIFIPNIDDLAQEFITLIKLQLNPTEKKEGQDSVNPLETFVSKLILIAYHEVLDDQGHLHPAIVKAFSLQDELKNEKKSRELTDAFVKGFIHQVLMIIDDNVVCRLYFNKVCKLPAKQMSLVAHARATVDESVQSMRNDPKLRQRIYDRFIELRNLLGSVATPELLFTDSNFYLPGSVAIYFLNCTARVPYLFHNVEIVSPSVEFEKMRAKIQNIRSDFSKLLSSNETYSPDFDKMFSSIVEMKGMLQNKINDTPDDALGMRIKPTLEAIKEILTILTVLTSAYRTKEFNASNVTVGKPSLVITEDYFKKPS